MVLIEKNMTVGRQVSFRNTVQPGGA